MWPMKHLPWGQLKEVPVVHVSSGPAFIAQAETLGYLISVHQCEVLLIQELFSELIDLLVSEDRSRLSLLFRWLRFTEQTQLVLL